MTGNGYEPTVFFTMSQIRQANKDAGHVFFSPRTMRFWKSRCCRIVHPAAKGGTYFVTSEDNYDHTARAYSVRYCAPDGHCGNAKGQDFNGYKTSKEAHKVARQLAKETT